MSMHLNQHHPKFLIRTAWIKIKFFNQNVLCSFWTCVKWLIDIDDSQERLKLHNNLIFYKNKLYPRETGNIGYTRKRQIHNTINNGQPNEPDNIGYTKRRKTNTQHN